MIRELTDEEKQAQMQPEGCRMQVKLQKVDEALAELDSIDALVIGSALRSR